MKKNNKLVIDTSRYGKIVFAMDKKSKAYKVLPGQGGRVLLYLHSFFRSMKIPVSRSGQLLKDRVTEIEVCVGVGHFTGLRAAVSVAMGLAFAWNIPIRFKKVPL